MMGEESWCFWLVGEFDSVSFQLRYRQVLSPPTPYLVTAGPYYHFSFQTAGLVGENCCPFRLQISKSIPKEQFLVRVEEPRGNSLGYENSLIYNFDIFRNMFMGLLLWALQMWGEGLQLSTSRETCFKVLFISENISIVQC